MRHVFSPTPSVKTMPAGKLVDVLPQLKHRQTERTIVADLLVRTPESERFYLLLPHRGRLVRRFRTTVRSSRILYPPHFRGTRITAHNVIAKRRPKTTAAFENFTAIPICTTHPRCSPRLSTDETLSHRRHSRRRCKFYPLACGW